MFIKQNTRQEGQRKKGGKKRGGGEGRGYRYVTIMQRFTDLLISHRPMRLRNSIGCRWTTAWIDHRVRCTRVRERASVVKNCVAADPIGVEGNLCGSGRYRAKVETPVEGRQGLARRSFSLLLSISRSTYVHEAPSLQGRFISSFSRFPYRCSFRTYLRARYSNTRTYVVFLTISALCFNSSMGMLTEVDVSNSVTQYLSHFNILQLIIFIFLLIRILKYLINTIYIDIFLYIFHEQSVITCIKYMKGKAKYV